MKHAVIRIHLEAQSEGGYTVTSPDVPDLITEGETLEQCMARAREVAELLYDSYKKHGDSMPDVFLHALPQLKTFDTHIEVHLRPPLPNRQA